MAIDITKVFVDNGKGYIAVNVPYIEIYIPMSFFGKTGALATDNGDTITTIGSLPVGIFENGKFKEYRTLQLGEMINLFVYDSDTRQMQLPGQLAEEPVRILKYFKGDEVMQNYIVQDSLNCQRFLELELKGKLPNTLPYDKIPEIWDKNLVTNKTGLGIPAVNRELIISVQYRDNKQPSRTFAQRLNSDPKATMFDYVVANIRETCRYTSTFAGMTYEDFDSMVTSSLKRTKDHQEEPESPLEKIIKL